MADHWAHAPHEMTLRIATHALSLKNRMIEAWIKVKSKNRHEPLPRRHAERHIFK
jgi:hypothetical protein